MPVFQNRPSTDSLILSKFIDSIRNLPHKLYQMGLNEASLLLHYFLRLTHSNEFMAPTPAVIFK